MIPTVTTIHHLTQQTYSTGTHEVEGKELYYMDTDFLVRKLDLLKVEKPERDNKITDSECENLVFDIFILIYSNYYNAKGEEGSCYSTHMSLHTTL